MNWPTIKNQIRLSYPKKVFPAAFQDSIVQTSWHSNVALDFDEPINSFPTTFTTEILICCPRSKYKRHTQQRQLPKQAYPFKTFDGSLHNFQVISEIREGKSSSYIAASFLWKDISHQEFRFWMPEDLSTHIYRHSKEVARTMEAVFKIESSRRSLTRSTRRIWDSSETPS